MKTLIWIILFFLLSVGSYAGEIGKVVKIVGKVIRINTDLRMDDILKAGDPVYKDDEIRSGKSSFVKILLVDDTIFQLGGNSRFKFEKFNNGKGKKKKAVYHLLYGKMRSLFIKQQSEDVLITTPTVSMGVRGTEILADVFWDNSDHKASLPKTEVALLSGKIEIQIATKEVSRMFLKAGEIFDSNKAMVPKLKDFSIQKMSKSVLQRLKTGKATFLFDAKQTMNHFPELRQNDFKKEIVPETSAIIDGRKRNVRKHLLKKDPSVLPPPPPPTLNTIENIPDDSLQNDAGKQ